MRILFSVHLYPPTHNCGGEYFIHNLSKFLISHGHQVRVLLHQAKDHGIEQLYTYEGIEVFPPGRGTAEALVLWADIMLTHLEFSHWTINIGKIFKRPVVFISHNTAFEAYNCVRDSPEVVVIYNSDAMRSLSPFQNRSLVLHPPVNYQQYFVNKDPWASKFITLINCNENKGGKIFSRLAAALPQRQFLAVKGSYDEQFIADLPNITVRENSPDILPLYAQTRILLMPSRYESWGLTATEAMTNGIPVICCSTFGLKENCGDAGIYIPERGPCEINKFGELVSDDGESYNIEPIIAEIKKLDNKNVYKEQSAKCTRRAKEHDPRQELEECESFLLSLSNG